MANDESVPTAVEIDANISIHVTCGRGSAPTVLAAFDEALLNAGIANFNLIYLSSVIPPGSRLIRKCPPPSHAREWGDRLYVVIAQQRETDVGTEAWAGLGWVQDEETGKGLFVEHQGNSIHHVEAQIEQSLTWMTSRRKGSWAPLESMTVGIACEHDPVCAVAAAAYASMGWG